MSNQQAQIPNKFNPFRKKESAPDPDESDIEEKLSEKNEAEIEPEDESHLSPWLYLGGLNVTLAGLYTVNYLLGDSNFALLTYALATFGYLASYTLRAYKVSLKALRLPLFIFLGLIAIVWLSNDPSLKFLSPAGESGDRGRELQLFFLWLAIVHSFTLTSDGNVLFSCVPCITLIALVSTGNTDSALQNAFLWFSASATFLLIHENFLKTRAGANKVRSLYKINRMFHWQIALAVGCVVLSFLFANLVAVPLHAMGQAIRISRVGDASQNQPGKQNNPLTPLASDSSRSINLSTGPQFESAVPVMSVKEKQPKWLRGTTYDLYTGHSFENSLKETQKTLAPESVISVPGTGSPVNSAPVRRFVFTNPLRDIPPETMKAKELFPQEITLLNGGMSQYFAAGRITELQTNKSGDLTLDESGTLEGAEGFSTNNRYNIISLVSNSAPDQLRNSSDQLYDFPENIRNAYLSVKTTESDSSVRLTELSQSVSNKAKNNFDRVQMLKEYVSSHCKYNLQAKAAPSNADRVEYFLIDGPHDGYCDSFAAALTMLCRYANIPARMASGYLVQPANRSEDGESYQVQQKDKHVWTEVYFNDYGWIQFDATEGAEDVSDHNAALKNRTAKNSFLKWLISAGWLPIAMSIGVVILLAYLFKSEIWDRFMRNRRADSGQFGVPETNRKVVAAYLSVCHFLAQKGMKRTPDMTPEEFLRTVCDKLGKASAVSKSLATLTALHARFRYSTEIAAEEDCEAARSEWQSLVSELNSHPRDSQKPGDFVFIDI